MSEAALWPDCACPPAGNRLLLPSPTVKQECKAVEENVGLIVYNGAMVDVGSLLQKLEKSERVRAEIEQKLQLLEEKTGGMLTLRALLTGVHGTETS